MMRLAAVAPATAVEPKPFMVAWIIRLPMAVTEYCSPMGTPI